MNQKQIPLFEETIPEYRWTKSEALKKLREKGVVLSQRELVYMMIVAHAPVTREYIEKLFEADDDLPNIKEKSICPRVNELMDEGRVKVVGYQKTPRGIPKEFLGLGKDERLRVKRDHTVFVDPVNVKAKPSFLLLAIAFVLGIIVGSFL